MIIAYHGSFMGSELGPRTIIFEGDVEQMN
jgi:hypothetical protein